MFFRELEANLQVLGESFLGVMGKIFLDLCGYLVHLIERIAFYHSPVTLSIAFLELKRTINAEKLTFDKDSYPIAK